MPFRKIKVGKRADNPLFEQVVSFKLYHLDLNRNAYHKWQLWIVRKVEKIFDFDLSCHKTLLLY